MKKIIFVCIVGFIFTIRTQAQDNFLGYWKNEGGSQIIKIYKVDNQYYGEIIFRKEITLKEIKNKIILFKMKKKNKKTLYGGTYFDSNLNEEYEVKLELENEKTINFTGIYGVSNIYNVWYKIP
jgi:uncharacterized protein (DUF2147 family)